MPKPWSPQDMNEAERERAEVVDVIEGDKPRPTRAGDPANVSPSILDWLEAMYFNPTRWSIAEFLRRFGGR